MEGPGSCMRDTRFTFCDTGHSAPGRGGSAGLRRGGWVGILRLSHVDVTVTDLDLAVAYYTEVIGMVLTERTAESAYLKCWDEADHHSLRLTYAPRTGFGL